MATENHFLNERGLGIRGSKKNQVKIGNYGIADIITIYRDTEIYQDIGRPVFCAQSCIVSIYELKKDSISMSAFLQAIGYLKGIKSYLLQRGILHNAKFEIKLIGRDIDAKSNLIYLPDIFDCSNGYGDCSISFYTYSYNIDGIFFKNQYDYRLTNEGF
jgi:hypothetical protein